MTKHKFLSDPWIDAATKLGEKHRTSLPESTVATKINVVVTDIEHRFDGQLEGHLDTTAKTPVVSKGHLEDPEVTVTIGYDTAKALLINPDPQELMAIFMQGKILVEGDASALIGAMSGQAGDAPAEALEFYSELEAITDY